MICTNAPVRCARAANYIHLSVVVIAIISLVISPTSSTPTHSYSSSSLSAQEGFDAGEQSVVESRPKSTSKTMTTTMTMTKGSLDCGCDTIQQVIDDVRETKAVCIDTALAIDAHVKKVGKLQVAVDGLAGLSNHADTADNFVESVPTPHPHISSSSSSVPASSFDDTDSNAEDIIENDPHIDNSDDSKDIRGKGPVTHSRLNGVHLVVMEAPEVTPRDCLEVQQNVGNVSGVYTILPDGCGQPFQVFCDMSTSGGGWTVIQRRLDGEVSFARLWGAYRRGFGNLLAEFWLGLDKMSRLTAQDDYELRIDLQDFNGTQAVAEYESVVISDYRSNFRLHVGSFKMNGSAGDSLSYHNHMPFTTTDRDNDLSKKNCAEMYSGGGWWYNGCLYSNLNGIYLGPDDDEFATGVTWFEFGGFRNSLKLTEIKVRPVP